MKEMICIRVGEWVHPNGSPAKGPAKDEIVNVLRDVIVDNELHYILDGYPFDYGYEASAFVPVADISELTEVLNAQLEPNL